MQRDDEYRSEAGRLSPSVGGGGGAAPSSFRSFDRTGINRDNPFMSRKSAILGAPLASAYEADVGAGGGAAAAGARVDRYAAREAARRREQEDERYFNAKFAGGRRTRNNNPDDEEQRSDEEYAYMRRDTELPLRGLSGGQRHTARELDEEVDDERSRVGGRSRTRAGAASAPVSARPRSASASIASDAHLLSTIDYLENFLLQSKRELSARRVAGPEWARRLDEMGGPERAARRGLGMEEREQEEEEFGQRRRSRSASRPASRYAMHTVSSSPLGRASPFSPHGARPRSGSVGRMAGAAYLRASPFKRPDHELELARMESEVAELRRKAAAVTGLGSGGLGGIGLGGRAGSARDREVDATLEQLRERGEIERSIAYLEDYTQGRRPNLDDSPMRRSRSLSHSPVRGLARSSSERLLSPSDQFLSSRVPSTHPHRTGRNHIPSACIYCRRELDWHSGGGGGGGQSERDAAIRRMQSSFPERATAVGEGLDSSVGELRHEAQSRLRPLAKRMLESASGQLTPTRDTHAHLHASPRSPLDADVHRHSHAQLGAAERRRELARTDSLWSVASSAARDKKAQLARIGSEIEAEALKRSAHLRWLEERSLDLTARAAAARQVQQERELQKVIREQSEQVARLLEFKRTALQSYARDQMALVEESARKAREAAKLQAQHERYNLRDMQRAVRENAEALKQRKLDQIRHSEEKYAFRLSELRKMRER